jgi:oligopeptide/dipeptide ABC transporter ATP-binding protein
MDETFDPLAAPSAGHDAPPVGLPVLAVHDLEIDVDVAGIGYCRAVDGVSFHVHRGETLALVGESGCGKSLTLLAILGLLPERGVLRTGGDIVWDGDAIRGESAHAALRGRRIGYVPQDPMSALNPVMTVGEQVTEAVRVSAKLSRRDAREQAVLLLERVGIPSARARFGAYPHELSGGQRQRVLIAIALAGDPELLVADEPTTALDVTVQAQILALLRTLQRDRALGIVLVTHDLGVVAHAADRVAVLYAGRVIETGPTRDVLRAPAHPYTRGLLDAVPSRHRTGRLSAIPGAVPPPGTVIQGCRFRARCPRAESRCAREDPPPHALDDRREVACHLPLGAPP